MLADCGYVAVVDDDPSLRQMVIKYPEDNNVPAKSASNRTEFDRHFAGTLPSLIILDLRLGQDDGLPLLWVRYRHGEYRASPRVNLWFCAVRSCHPDAGSHSDQGRVQPHRGHRLQFWPSPG